jgi:ectoine hydroxylase-related dioxygenase (phytanoyl-CoA dioxygenase family)
VTTALDAALATSGWAVVEGLFEPRECDDLVAASEARTWPTITAALARWIVDPRWAPVVLPALGPEVRFLREQPVTKPPHAEAVVPWHQDSAYLPVDPVEFLTCFVALEDISVDNGCLWVRSGSHRDGLFEHRRVGCLVEAVGDDTGGESGDGVVGEAVELARGSVLVLSSLTCHRSGPNRTAGVRRAWIVQFCRAHTVDRRSGQPHPGCPVVAEAGVWLDRPRP